MQVQMVKQMFLYLEEQLLILITGHQAIQQEMEQQVLLALQLAPGHPPLPMQMDVLGLKYLL